ncbi:MAG TPA: DUF5132 domain-containing protein [Desulfomonilaceae bacterium]|nr:DUF5132 domain-containing protein [Desulfomonilaceae bacterium]
MAIWDYRPRGDVWTGVAIGVGLMVAPVVIPVIGAVLRPVAKAAVKSGYFVYEKSCEMCAEVTEALEDLAVEAKSEVRAEMKAAKGQGA